MSGEKGTDVAWIYKVLGHPQRKKIIESIAEKEGCSFTELRQTLNTSVGALYFHLDTLGSLITQDSHRRYVLTDQGKLAHKILKDTADQISTIPSTKTETDPAQHLKQILLPSQLFLHISNNPVRYIPITILTIIGSGALLTIPTGLEFILLFPVSRPTENPAILAISLVVSWLLFTALCNLLSVLLFKREAGNLTLLTISPFSYLPLTLFTAIWHTNNALGLPLTTASISIFLILTQAWAIAIMSTALSISKGLRIEKAALCVLAVVYANLACMTLINAYR